MSVGHADGVALLIVAHMPQTPVTSSPVVAGFLSNLPAYRIGVSPLLRGVEIGLVHGFLAAGQRPAPYAVACVPVRSGDTHPSASQSLSCRGNPLVYVAGGQRAGDGAPRMHSTPEA